MFGRIGGGSKNHDSNKPCPVGGEGKYSTHTVNA